MPRDRQPKAGIEACAITTTRALLAFAAFAAFASPAFAEESAPQVTQAAQPAPAANHPWEADQALLDSLQTAVNNGGIMAVQPHASEIEQALAKAKLTFDIREGDRIVRYVLTDGQTDMLLAMTLAATEAGKSQGIKQAVAVNNPYPLLSLYLGSYYNEIGKSADSLRVLDRGLALDGTLADLGSLGATWPGLMAERGAALNALKRYGDALADYEQALQAPGLDAGTRALLDRGRGFALTELGRLDDAEAAYNDSLKYEPGNEHAEHELQYIANLKRGSAPAAGSLTLAYPPGAPAPQSPAPANPGH